MRTYHHLLHLPHLRLKTSTALFIGISLRTFFFAYFSLFIPVIIYQYYQHLGHDIALYMLGLIYLVVVSLPILVFPLLARAAMFFGYKPILIISQVFLLAGLALMQRYYFLPGALFFGLASICWWVPYYVIFLDVTDSKQTGQNVGILEALGALSGVLAPIIGGAILTYTSLSLFYLVSLLVIIISILPLTKSRNRFTKHTVSYKDMVNMAIRYKADLLAFIGAGGENFIYSIYWPLFLFFLLKSQLSLGIFASLITLSAAFLSYIIGRLSNQSYRTAAYQKIGTATFSVSWLGKTVWSNPLAVSAFDIIHRIFNPFFTIPLTTMAFNRAQKDSVTNYIIFRDIGYGIGKGAVILITLIITYFNLPFWLIFLIAALLSLSPLKIRPDNSNRRRGE